MIQKKMKPCLLKLELGFHFVKSVQIQSFSGLYFPVFRPNTEIYSVNLQIQSKCGKMRTRKTLYLDNIYTVFCMTRYVFWA